MSWYKKAQLNEEDDLAQFAWLDAIPEDPYGLCPCGCGQKMKYIIQEAKDLMDKGVDSMEIDHEAIFIAKWKAERAKK